VLAQRAPRLPQATALPEGNNDLHQRQWLATLTAYWHHLLEAIAASCVDWHPDVRSHALVLLHNVLTSAVDNLHLNAETWGLTWRELILPVLNELASTMQEQAANQEDTRPLARTLCLAVNVTHKTFVLHLRELSGLREWRALWLSTLQVLVSRPRTLCLPA
jgi:hypothetical protein